MINDYHILSGLQKVAILFSVVGESLALSLVKGLSKTNIRKIRSTVREMESVSYVVKKRVMEEFYFGFLSEQFESGDKEEGPIQPFEFLKSLNEEQLNALVKNEDSPVIAMVMAQLEPEQRMKILDKVDPKLKGQILLELGSLGDIPLEGVIEVAARMKEKATYLPRTTEFSRGGGKEIADIIGSMEASEEEKYLQTLQNENPELYKEVKKYHLTFDDILEKFPDNTKRELFVGADLTELALAMKGLDQEIVDQIIEGQPQKRQAMFEPVEGAVAKRDVDNARKKIVVNAKEMADSGSINLEDILSGGEMVE
jgi:flagellar motor switch protein FliG